MKSRLLLDVVVGQSTSVLELLSGEDETLLVRRDSLLVLNLSLDVVDGITRLNIKRNGLSGEGLYKNLFKSWRNIIELASATVEKRLNRVLRN